MQAITKKLGVTFTILFFISVAFSAYTFYKLPEQMIREVQAIDLKVVGQLQPILFQIYLTVGVTALMGLLAITLLILSSRAYQNGIVTASNSPKSRKETAKDHDAQGLEEESVNIDHEAIEGIIASEKDVTSIFTKAMSIICKELEASQAAAYIAREEKGKHYIELFATYAYHLPEGEKKTFRYGEGLAGQVAKEGKLVNIDAVPEGYIQILSGLGSASPRHLIIIPLKEAATVIGVVEIASFHAFKAQHEIALQQAFDKLALKLVNDDNVSLEKAKREKKAI
jgi:putative methionine-R-sulfoxide reductase with GAF domain